MPQIKVTKILSIKVSKILSNKLPIITIPNWRIIIRLLNSIQIRTIKLKIRKLMRL